MSLTNALLQVFFSPINRIQINQYSNLISIKSKTMQLNSTINMKLLESLMPQKEAFLIHSYFQS